MSGFGGDQVTRGPIARTTWRNVAKAGTFQKGHDPRRKENPRKGTKQPTFRGILASMPEGVHDFFLSNVCEDAPDIRLDPYQWALAWQIRHIKEGNWHALQDFLNRTVGKPADTLNLRDETPPDPFDDIDPDILHRLIDIASGSNGGNGSASEAGAGTPKPARLP